MRFDFCKRQFVEIENEPGRPALIGSDRRLTWKELYDEVEQLKRDLDSYQGPHALAVLRGRKQASMIVSLLACYSKGIPYVPVDTMMPDNRLESICQIAAATVLLRAEYPLQIEKLTPTGDTHPRADDLAYIIFTSGSTGEPKGVQIQKPNVHDLATWVKSSDFGFTADDVVCNHCSFGFDVSLFDTIAALQAGGTLVLMSSHEVPEGCQPTVWSSTPSALSLALTSATFSAQRFPALRDFYLAGEVIHHSLAQRLVQKFPQAKLWNAYGPTEATVITTLIELTPELLQRYPTVPIGHSKPGVEMRTSAENGTDEGELLILGPNVSPGYLNRPDLNPSKFFVAEGRRGYRTGDVSFVKDGLIFYKGRIDHQIKLHGYRIELDEIDVQIGKIEGVELAATVPLRSREGDVKKLVCFVKLAPGADRSQPLNAWLKEKLGETLPYYMIPADFKEVEDFPYSSSHKIDKKSLAESIAGKFA